jgi:hypothetical protein
VTLEECLRVSGDQNEFLRLTGHTMPEGDGGTLAGPLAGQNGKLAAAAGGRR